MENGRFGGSNFENYHEKKKNLIEEFCQSVNSASEQIALDKASSNLFRPRVKKSDGKLINLKNFNSVIHIDSQNLTADVEGLTTYEDLVSEALKQGCLPPVVPELKSITVGGAIAGIGIESSSFQYGLVHETVKEMDVLLSDGSVVTCTADNENKELFFAIPNSYGTFGYILRIKLQLIPAKKFVKLTHLHYANPTLYFNELKQFCDKKQSNNGDEIDYIDGVVFSFDKMVITLGKFVEEAPFTSSYRYMHIYYKSLESKKDDYLSSLDYIWRWDTDWFWCSKVFGMQNRFLRLIAGKFMLGSRTYKSIYHFFNRHPSLYSLMKPIQGERESIIQDTLIPIEHAEMFLKFFQCEIKIKPIWICPTRTYSKKDNYPFCPFDADTLYIDFGFWDSLKTEHEPGFYNKKIEAEVTKLKGVKGLYSTSYYTEDEFWQIYNKHLYSALKKKYDPKQRLGNLYAKCMRK